MPSEMRAATYTICLPASLRELGSLGILLNSVAPVVDNITYSET